MTKVTGTMKIAMMSCLCLAMSACSHNDSASPSPASAGVSDQSAGLVPAVIPPSGSTLETSSVSSSAFSAGQTATGGTPMTYAQILAAHPILASEASYLGTVNSVVETNAPGFDLYANGQVVMTLSYVAATGALEITQSASPLTASPISYQTSVDPTNAKNSIQSITFEMADCIAQPTPVQQGKGKVPPVTPPPVCASTQAILNLQQVVQQQQQQGKFSANLEIEIK